jgi:hypothetical protein
VTRVGVTSGLRGFFAILYDADGPIQSSPITCRTELEAAEDAQCWADGEGLMLDGSVAEMLKRYGRYRPERDEK